MFESPSLLFAFGSMRWKVSLRQDCCIRLDKCCGVKASAVTGWWFHSIGVEVQSLPGYSKCCTKFSCVASIVTWFRHGLNKDCYWRTPQAYGTVLGWFRRAEFTWGRSQILSLCCARLICLVRSWFPIFVGRDVEGANSISSYFQFHRSLLSLCISYVAPVLDDQCTALVLNES